MCGIVGVCTPDGAQPVDKETLARMTGTIAHRGPDGETFHTDQGVGLGHRRLSIIDIDGGTQPIFGAEGTLAVIFNGEIYNYKELRAELQQAGYRFKTQSDTEVIVHLYDQLGSRCVDRLNGMFAFAIWDKRDRTLFLARDRFGEKPLYYWHKADGTLVFASELKAVRASDPVSALEIDPGALESYLAYGYVPSPKSIYQGVRKLPAAHTLKWRNGKVQIDRYWDHMPASTSSTMSGEEALAALEDLVENAIRIRLRSDVPVGAFLSGGIDSSLVVAMASEISSKPLATFSVGFNEKEFDESDYAKQVAERYGTEHHEIVVKDLNLDVFPDLVRQFDEPFADPSALPTYYVTRGAAQHLKVCLSGDAGDELFAGYPQYALEFGEQSTARLPASIRKLVFGNLARALPDQVPGKGWLRRMSVTGSQRYQRIIGTFDTIERSQLLGLPLPRGSDTPDALFEPFFTEGRSVIESRMLADQATYLTDDILVKVDRNSMLHSLEVRVPFLDHRIAELANSLPLNVRLRDNEQKWMLKSLLAKRMSAEFVGRRKQGFSMPIRDWLRSSYRDLAEDLLLKASNRSHSYLSPAAIRNMFDAHQAGKRDFSDRLWALMCFEQWCRTFDA